MAGNSFVAALDATREREAREAAERAALNAEQLRLWADEPVYVTVREAQRAARGIVTRVERDLADEIKAQGVHNSTARMQATRRIREPAVMATETVLFAEIRKADNLWDGVPAPIAQADDDTPRSLLAQAGITATGGTYSLYDEGWKIANLALFAFERKLAEAREQAHGGLELVDA